MIPHSVKAVIHFLHHDGYLCPSLERDTCVSVDKQGFALHCCKSGIDSVETNQSNHSGSLYVLIRSKGALRPRFVFHRTRSAKHPSKVEQGLFRESNSGAFQTANVILTLR